MGGAISAIGGAILGGPAGAAAGYAAYQAYSHSSARKQAVVKMAGAAAVTLSNPITGAGLILGGTGMKPWQVGRWENFDNKDAAKGVIVAHVIAGMVGTTIAGGAAAFGIAGVPKIFIIAAASGWINAYMNCRDGGTLQDVAASYYIGWGTAYLMPTPLKIPLLESILIGVVRGGVTNFLTQGYNITFGQKTFQNEFDMISFGKSLFIGGAMGALNYSVKGDLTPKYNDSINLATVKILTFHVLAIEEVIYWGGRL